MRGHYTLLLTLFVAANASVSFGSAIYTYICPDGAQTGAERAASGEYTTAWINNGKSDASLVHTDVTPTNPVLTTAGQGGTGSLYNGTASIVQLIAADETQYALANGATGAQAQVTLTRISDSADQVWAATPGAGIIQRARYAGSDNTIGYVKGASGPVNASTFILAGAAIANLTVDVGYSTAYTTSNSVGGDIKYVTGVDLANISNTEFDSVPGDTGWVRFVLNRDGTNMLSSLNVDNTLLDAGRDHMVTWQETSGYITSLGQTRYICSFENAFSGADYDYNDYTFEMVNFTNMPEPATLGLLTVGTVAFGLRRRKK